jgi:hypothetical protein
VELTTNIDDNAISISGIPTGGTITVYGEDGADDFIVTDIQAGATVRLYGEAAADKLTLSEGDLSTIAGTVHFNGGSGSDTITLDDTKALSGRVVTFDTVPTIVTGTNGFGSLTFTTTVEDVILLGSNHDDQIRVDGLDYRTDLELFGNGGNDTFLIADSQGTLDPVRGGITIHGGTTTGPHSKKVTPTDTDVLIIYDDQQKLAGLFSVSSNSVIGTIEKDDFNLTFDGIEEAELFLGKVGDEVKIHAVPLTTHFTVHGGPGEDLVELSPTAKNLGSVLGTISFDGGTDQFAKTLKGDRLILNDQNYPTTGNYNLSDGKAIRSGWLGVDYSGLEVLQLNTSAEGSTSNISSTTPGTTNFILGNAGNDDVIVSGMSSQVLFQGNTGIDTARLVGTSLADTFVVSGDTIYFGDGSLTTMSDVERRIIDGGTRQDLLHIVGVEGVDELFRIRPTTTAYTGVIEIGTTVPLHYQNLEELLVTGNSNDDDTLRMDGRRHPTFGALTNYSDVFDINLTANGTYQDPALTLRDSTGKQFLRLRDFNGLSDVEFNGLGGADTFNVLIAPETTDVSRSIRIVGGGSTNSLLGDQLNVTYAEPDGEVNWTPEADDSGTLEFFYSVNLFEIDYDGFGVEDINLSTV